MFELLALPLEVQEEIFERCESKHLQNLALCNSHCHNMLKERLWRNLFIEWPSTLGVDWRRKTVRRKLTNLKHARKLIFNGASVRILKHDQEKLLTIFKRIIDHCEPEEMKVLLMNDRHVQGSVVYACQVFTQLQELSLHGGRIELGVVATLSKLSSLEVLDLGGSNIEDEQLIVLVDNLKNLQRLNLNCSYELTSKSLVCVVSDLPHLKELFLDISCVDDNLLSLMVEKLPHLQRLELCSNLITKDGMQSISKLHHLRHLVIVGCLSITGLSLTCISSLNMLQTLNISDSHATDDVMWCVSQLLKLRKLVMNSCENVTDVGMSHISKLPLLECLEISFNEITDVGLNHLSALSNLRSLMCKRTYITSPAVQPFIERMYVEWSEGTV